MEFEALSGNRRGLTSTFPVNYSTVLYPVDNHDSDVVIDFVDQSIVSTPSSVQAGEFTDQFLA